MPTNKDMIVMHLMDYLKETGQYRALRWDGVLAYCLGYYGEITEDHLEAVRMLERLGAVLVEYK